MRFTKTIACLAFVAFGGLTAAPVQAKDPFPYICTIGTRDTVVAVTQMTNGDLSIDDITYHLNSYIYDARKGRISAPFDASQDLHAYCVWGHESVVRSHWRSYPQALRIKSPLDERGYWRRPRTAGAAKAVAPPTSSKPKPGAPSTVAASPAPIAQPKGPTPNQLKYQRELGEHQARLAEIERIKAATAAKHSAGQAAAAAELARHQREKAAADAARRTYEADLAAHQRLIDQRQTQQDRERKVDWREAVVVCNLNPSDGQSRFGNWRCDGPLQMTYAKLGSSTSAPSGQQLVSLSQACGGRPESVRDLGLVGTSRLFGCSYGLHPKSSGGHPLDAARKHGITFVPGRAIYRCPDYVSACRTK